MIIVKSSLVVRILMNVYHSKMLVDFAIDTLDDPV